MLLASKGESVRVCAMVVLRGKCEGLMACHLSVKSVSRQ